MNHLLIDLVKMQILIQDETLAAAFLTGSLTMLTLLSLQTIL